MKEDKKWPKFRIEGNLLCMKMCIFVQGNHENFRFKHELRFKADNNYLNLALILKTQFFTYRSKFPLKGMLFFVHIQWLTIKCKIFLTDIILQVHLIKYSVQL